MNIQKERALVVTGLILVFMLIVCTITRAGYGKYNFGIDRESAEYPKTVQRVANQYYVTDYISYENLFRGKALAENEIAHVYLMERSTGKLVGIVSASDNGEDVKLENAQEISWRPVDLLNDGGLDYGVETPATGDYAYLFVRFENAAEKDLPVDYPKLSYDKGTYKDGTLYVSSGQQAEGILEIVEGKEAFRIVNTIPVQENG